MSKTIKLILKTDFKFKKYKSIVILEKVQAIKNWLSPVIEGLHLPAITLYFQSWTVELELRFNDIKRAIQRFLAENDKGFDAEPSNTPFKHYYEWFENWLKFETEKSVNFLRSRVKC